MVTLHNLRLIFTSHYCAAAKGGGGGLRGGTPTRGRTEQIINIPLERYMSLLFKNDNFSFALCA